MVICIFLVTMLFMTINFILLKRLFNFISVFLILWCIVSVLSSFGFYGLYIPDQNAYMYILIVMVMFEISALLFLKLRTPSFAENKTFYLKWKKINVMSFLCLLGLFPYSMKGIMVALTEGFYRLRLSGFSNLLYSTNEKLILMNIIQPVVLAITILSLIELIQNKKIRISMIISVMNCFLFILIFGGRWILLEFILLAGIILYDTYSGNIIRLLKNNKLILVVMSIVIISISSITLQRSVGGGDGLIYNVYIYFVGSVHLFGVYIKNPLTYGLGADHLLYGKEFFAGFLEPIYLLANFRGLEWKSGVETINEITQQFVFVSSDTIMNNNVTMIYAFLRDFGIWGLFLCPIVLGGVYSFLYKANIKTNNFLCKGLYYYSLSIMPFLLFEWMPARMSIIMVPFILFVLTRRSFRTENK